MIFGLFGREKKRIVEMINEARIGDTPILAAIDKCQWATAEYLLTQRPDLTREDNNENLPPYLTVPRGDSLRGERTG